jgi:3-hydroxyisobutyrate dehydrogenase-like beta-hydroxyacid dehydrogenase
MSAPAPGTVGILGLGDMGSGMAQNLVRAGYEVVAADPGPHGGRAAALAGARLLPDPVTVATAATTAVLCVVRTEAQCRDALLGDHGAAHGARAGLPIVLASTLAPSTARDLAAELSVAGLPVVSAALSGGPWGARAGTLTFMVSGPSPTTAALGPLFDAMGSRTYVLSERPEVAQAAKLGVQLMYAVNMFGVFEALRLGVAFELDPEQLAEMYPHSVADSWVARNWPHVREWWEGNGNGLDILLKDVRAALREADTAAVPLPVTGLSFDLLRTAWPAFGHGLPAAAPSPPEPRAWT